MSGTNYCMCNNVGAAGGGGDSIPTCKPYQEKVTLSCF